MMAPFGIDPVGFKYIKIFHLCFGVSYFGYYTNTNVKYITMGTTLLYLILQILANVPCFFHCTFDTKELFGKAGLSPNFMSFIIVYLDLYHVVMTCLIIMSRGGKIREFFNELHDYSRNFGVKLVTTQKNKLMATAVRLIFYNIVHIVGEVLMLTLLVEHKLARQPKSAVVNMMYVPSSGSNSTSKPEEDDESLIPLSYSFWYHLNLFLKLFSVVYSKVIETVLVYIATYLAMVLKRLESRFDKFIYTKAGGRSIEVAKVAFIEMQNLIKGADEVFSHTAFDPLFVNVLIVLIGLFVAIDGITRRRTLDHNDWHELYNAFSSFFAIYMCCEYFLSDSFMTMKKEDH